MDRNEGEKEYVICVSVEDPHTEDAILVMCIRCPTMVWVSPHHVGKREPLCIRCGYELVKSEKNATLHILPEDLKRAADEIRKMGGLDEGDNSRQ